MHPFRLCAGSRANACFARIHPSTTRKVVAMLLGNAGDRLKQECAEKARVQHAVVRSSYSLMRCIVSVLGRLPGRWLAIRLNGMLFSQNQFAVTGNSQAILIAVMFNDNFMLRIEQLFAVEFTFTAGRFRHADWVRRRCVSGVVHGNPV